MKNPKSKICQVKLTAAFTLIELLIATSIGMLLMITVSTLFFVATLHSAKIEARRMLKTNGEAIRRNLDFLIKNSIKLLPNDQGDSCQTNVITNLNSLRLKSIDNGITDLKLVTDQSHQFIASNSTYLNPDSITPSNFSFSCFQNATGERYVTYQFDLSLANFASQHFSSFIFLRNN